MLKTANRNLVLAIESALAGGSVALVDRERVVDFVQGTSGISRSEDLLLLVQEILEKNRIERDRIGLIAVSEAPGSVTGLRIGLATAQGIAAATGAAIYKTSIFEAMLAVDKNEITDSVAVSVYDDGKKVYSKTFARRIQNVETEFSGELPLRTFGLSEFKEYLKEARRPGMSFLMTENLKSETHGIFADEKEAEGEAALFVKGALASLIGRAGAMRWAR